LVPVLTHSSAPPVDPEPACDEPQDHANASPGASKPTFLKRHFGIGPEDDSSGIPASNLIYPISTFYLAWLATTGFFLAYTAVFTPYTIAFYFLDSACSPVPTVHFDAVLDTFFIVDIFVQLVTGEESGTMDVWMQQGPSVTSVPLFHSFSPFLLPLCYTGTYKDGDYFDDLKTVRHNFGERRTQTQKICTWGVVRGVRGKLFYHLKNDSNEHALLPGESEEERRRAFDKKARE
jgi:hypothetical protein